MTTLKGIKYKGSRYWFALHKGKVVWHTPIMDGGVAIVHGDGTENISHYAFPGNNQPMIDADVVKFIPMDGTITKIAKVESNGKTRIFGTVNADGSATYDSTRIPTLDPINDITWVFELTMSDGSVFTITASHV